MSNLDFSKPRQTYKELFGADMPKEVEAVISKLCLLWNVRPDNMEITHFIITGWLQQKMVAIPEAVLAKTEQAGASIKATGDALVSLIVKSGRELVKDAQSAVKTVAEMQNEELKKQFAATATAELKRVANEARDHAPADYRMWVNLLAAGVLFFALGGGFLAGWWGQRWHISTSLEQTSNDTYFFPPSINLRMHNGTPVDAIKITGPNRAVLIPGKGSDGQNKGGEKKGLFSWLFK